MTKNSSNYSNTGGKYDSIEAMGCVVTDPNNQGLKRSNREEKD